MGVTNYAKFLPIISGAPPAPGVDHDIAATDSLILSLSPPGDAGVVSGFPQHYWGGYSHCEARIEVKARSAVANVMSRFGEVMYVYVDGVLIDTATVDSVWKAIPLTLGPTDDWHEIMIKNAVSPAGQGIFVKSANMLTVNTAAAVYKRFPINFSTQALKNLNDAGVRLDGIAWDGGVGGVNTGYSRTATIGNAFRFRAAPTAAKPYIHIYASRVIDRIALFEDGVYVEQVLLAPPGGGDASTYNQTQVRQWWRFTPPNPDGTEHEYELKNGRCGDNPEFIVEFAVGVPPSFSRINVEGFNAASTPAARSGKWAAFGDSIAWGMGNAASGTGQFTWESFTSQIIRGKGKAEYNWSRPGDKWSDYTAGPSLAGQSIDVLLIPSLGVNNALQDVTIAQTKADVYTTLHRNAGDVNTMIYVMPILPTFPFVNYSGKDLAAYRTAIAEVIAGGATTAGTLTAGEIAKITLLGMPATFDAETQTTDGLHPNQAGHDALAVDYATLII